MKTKTKIALSVLISVVLIVWGLIYLQTTDIPVLFPNGMIGLKQRDLLVLSTLLMLIVVIPVFFLTFYIIWKYRAGNPKAKYDPDWDNNHTAELIWWGVPFLIIVVLSIFVWTTSHDLSPYKPLVSDTKPIKIQVVGLQWRWLFIYPEQKIATVNFIQFPKNTPLNFELTSDAPMNSFWIPALGGQIYAMPGMKTKLHLIANEIGSFRGLSAHLSGVDFAGMTFTAKASSQEDFDEWVESVRNASSLTLDTYKELAEPQIDHSIYSYVLDEKNLFEWIVMKYMMPQAEGMDNLEQQ